jgi:hypothetical protein
MVMVEMKVLLVLMKSSAMMMTMATISPLREEIFPTDFCLPESFSLSRCFSAPQRRWCLSLMPPNLGFRGHQYT